MLFHSTVTYRSAVLRRLIAVAACAAAFTPAALAATSTSVTAPAYDARGRLVQTPVAPPPGTSPAVAAQPRSRDAPLADRVAVVLQPRRRLHVGAALLSRARLGRRARPLHRLQRPRHAGTRALARVGAARSDRLSRRLPHRVE